MAAFELEHDNIEMAAMLLTSFHCLLRTGEALKMCCSDLVLGSATGVLQLRSAKTSQRFSANDAIAITDPLVVDVLQTLVTIRQRMRCLETPVWRASAQLFRDRFKALMLLYDLALHGFRPYSLRRGGATHLFQTTHSMETWKVGKLKGRQGLHFRCFKLFTRIKGNKTYSGYASTISFDQPLKGLSR